MGDTDNQPPQEITDEELTTLRLHLKMKRTVGHGDSGIYLPDAMVEAIIAKHDALVVERDLLLALVHAKDELIGDQEP